MNWIVDKTKPALVRVRHTNPTRLRSTGFAHSKAALTGCVAPSPNTRLVLIYGPAVITSTQGKARRWLGLALRLRSSLCGTKMWEFKWRARCVCIGEKGHRKVFGLRAGERENWRFSLRSVGSGRVGIKPEYGRCVRFVAWARGVHGTHHCGCWLRGGGAVPHCGRHCVRTCRCRACLFAPCGLCITE